MYPGLRQPIPVAFVARLSDILRVLQPNRLELGTALQRASYSLVSDVFARQGLDERVERRLAKATGLEDEAARPIGGAGAATEVVEDDDIDDAVVSMLGEVVNGIITGTSLGDKQRGKINRYIANQEARAELIANLVQTDDYRRLLRLMKARQGLEKTLIRAMGRDDLNPSEMLALHQVVTSEVSTIAKGVRVNANNVSDVLGLLEKADAAFGEQEELMARKFEKTTPQGREVIRRLAHRLSKLKKD